MLLIIDNQGGFAREVAPFAEELKIIFARDAAQVTPNLPILKPEDVIIVPHTNMEATLREQGITNKIVPLQYRNATVQDLYIAAMGHPRYGTYLDNPFELVVDSAPEERPAPAPKTDKRMDAPHNEQREPRQEQREQRPDRREDREPRQERRDEQRRDNKRDDRRDNKNQRDRKDQRQGDKQRQERRDNKNQRQDKQRQDREPRQELRDEQRRDNKRDEKRRPEQIEPAITTPEVKPEPVVVPAEPAFEIPAFEEVQTNPVVEPVKPEPVAETAKSKPQVGPKQVREVLEFEVESRTDGRVNEGTVKIDRQGRNGYVDYLVYADGRKEEIGRRNPVSRQERVGTKPVPKDEGSGAPASEPETIVPAFDFGGDRSVAETMEQGTQIDGQVLDVGSDPRFKTEEPVFVTEDAVPNFITEPKVDEPVFKTTDPEINFISEDATPSLKTETAAPRFTDEPIFKTESAAPNFVTEDAAPNFVTEPAVDAPVFETEEPVFKTETETPNFVTENPTVRVQPKAAPAQQAPTPVIRQRNAGDFDDDELDLVRDQDPEPAEEGGDFTLNFI